MWQIAKKYVNDQRENENINIVDSKKEVDIEVEQLFKDE